MHTRKYNPQHLHTIRLQYIALYYVRSGDLDRYGLLLRSDFLVSFKMSESLLNYGRWSLHGFHDHVLAFVRGDSCCSKDNHSGGSDNIRKETISQRTREKGAGIR